MEQDLRDILEKFASKIYINAQGKSCLKATDRNKFAHKIVKLCDSYIAKERAVNKWLKAIKYIGYFTAGAYVGAIIFGVFL